MSSVNTDGNILLIYIERNIVGKEGIKKMPTSMITCHFYKQNY